MGPSQEMRKSVIDAANELYAEGVANPTNNQVRSRLGKGSLSHISPIMKEWRESRKSEAKAFYEMPESLSRSINESVGRLWVQATKLASASFDGHRKEVDQAVQEANSERDEALNEIGRLERSIAALEKSLEMKSAKVDELESQLENERELRSTLVAEKASINADLVGRKERIDALEGDLEVMRNDYRMLQAELLLLAKSGGAQATDD